MEKANNSAKPIKLLRCIEWLENQNSKPQRSVRNKNNSLKYIVQTNADRKRSLRSAGGDEATVPTGVNEPPLKPKVVPIYRLRYDKLCMECEWQYCKNRFSNYDLFQKHIQGHIPNVHRIEKDDGVEYACLWDVCGYKTSDFQKMVRHVNYHAYHAKLLAIGFNGRATLKLDRCKKDSRKRNHLPEIPCEYTCMWTGCEEKFNAVQGFFNHVELHILESDLENEFLCSWAGCGAKHEKRPFLKVHVRTHTNERLIACYHCGRHFATNRKLMDHLRRQNVSKDSPYCCSMCGTKCATEYLLSEHTRQHVSAYVCALCDMSAPTGAALAMHVRYRHLPHDVARAHACPHCDYRAVTKMDLRKHILTHNKRKKPLSDEESEDNRSKVNEEDSDGELKKKKKKVPKKYACHLCPEKNMKIYARGVRLTKHLVKEHGAQWPFGHSRFRYQISEDGMYRLTTTRYEVLEVSKKIVDRDCGPKEILTNKFEFNVKQVAEPTETTPRKFEITLKNDSAKEIVEESQKNDSDKEEISKNPNLVEITMCDVDEDGNVIKSQVMYS